MEAVIQQQHEINKGVVYVALLLLGNLGNIGCYIISELRSATSTLNVTVNDWAGGATVARSTPDRKAACSNHVRVR